jgi:hypothetical protein
MIGILRLTLAAAVLLLAPASDGWASGDHGAAKVIVVSPRAEARVGTRQFILVYANRQLFEDRKFKLFGNVQRPKFDKPRLALFVEDFATAAPVAGAEVEAMVNFLPEAMSEIAPGVYVTEEVVLGGGRNEVEVTFTLGDESATVPMMLVVAGGDSAGTASAAAAVSAVKPVAIPSWVFVAAGLAVYAVAAGLFLIRRQRSAASAEPQSGHGAATGS